jgi:hypothetical protein
MCRTVNGSGAMSLRQRALLRFASTHADQSAAQAVDLLCWPRVKSVRSPG